MPIVVVATSEACHYSDLPFYRQAIKTQLNTLLGHQLGTRLRDFGV